MPHLRPVLKVGASGAYIANVRRCGSVWMCAYCAAKIARHRASEVRRAITRAREAGLYVTMVTQTLSHGPDDQLPALLDGLTSAMRRLRAGRWWQDWARRTGYVGQIRNLEVTWGRGTGWHPHAHGLLFTDRPIAWGDECDLRARWAQVVAREGLFASDSVGLHLSADANDVDGYLTKLEQQLSEAEQRELRQGRWGAAEELAFSHAKDARGRRFSAWGLVAELVATGEAEYGDLFVVYAAAFHGRRHLYWSKGLRDMLGLGSEATDTEVAEADGEGGTVAAWLTERTLAKLYDAGLVPDLLLVTERGGPQAAWEWLAEWSGRLRPSLEFDPTDWWGPGGVWTDDN